MKKNVSAIFVAAFGTMCLAGPAVSAPMTLDLTGRVTQASGIWSGDVDSSVFVSLTFDLNPGNAAEIIDVTGIPDEFAETRWAFVDDGFTGYGGSLFGALDSVGNNGIIELETIDNLDFDLVGNPFGVSGVADVLGFILGNATAICAPEDQSPVTGFCPVGSEIGSGSDYAVYFIGDSSWFDGGDVLPSTIPTNVLIFGDGEMLASRVPIADATIDFNTVTAVPLPAAGWVLLGGLAGLWSIRRSRHAA